MATPQASGKLSADAMPAARRMNQHADHDGRSGAAYHYMARRVGRSNK